ncbi:MAG: hypothetical protein M1495_21905 [Bacteroidetes bacterium]|nr:hypothetical protein [Bacteroidota bacterium]
MTKRYSGISLITLLFLLYYSFNIYAQRSEYGASIEPSFKVQSILGQTSFTTGARFGFVIHEHFSIGGGYYASVNSLAVPKVNSQDAVVHFNMGGLELETLLLKFDQTRISVSFFAGSGAFYKSASSNSNINFSTNNFLAWEPELSSEIEILQWLRLNLGLGYRFISYTKGVSNSDADCLKGTFAIVAFSFHTK